MINDQTILSSFDDKPTLLEWLKKVEDALKTDTATAVSVENPSANTYVFKITFADGTTLSSGNVVFPDSVKDVSIKNNHIIVTSVGGNVEDLGVLNPYADTIVVNAETNTTEIGSNVSISGNVAMGGNLGVTGQAVVGGRLQVNSSIISNGEIRGGDISGSKFLLGTEEMPLVKANPTGEATETLEKVKIGNVAYNVGGGGSNDREITLTMPYASNSPGNTVKFSYIEKEIYDKINQFYYDTIKVYYNDGNPIGIFHVTRFTNWSTELYGSKYYACIGYENSNGTESTWYGKSVRYTFFMAIKTHYITSDNLYYFDIIRAPEDTNKSKIPFDIDKSKFDALYKLADKPTQDGNYILKASVSGGVVTYTWELQQ